MVATAASCGEETGGWILVVIIVLLCFFVVSLCAAKMFPSFVAVVLDVLVLERWRRVGSKRHQRCDMGLLLL